MKDFLAQFEILLYLCTANLQKYRNITKKIAIKNIKIDTIMKEFLTKTGMTILEEPVFKERITDSSRDFYFTEDQYYNRWRGRTKVTPAERMAMVAVLDEIRNEMQHV